MLYTIDKKALLEEAVHAGNPRLDKRNPETAPARSEQASMHREIKRFAQKTPNKELANKYDNLNRAISQQGAKPDSVKIYATKEATKGTLTHKPVNKDAEKYLYKEYKQNFNTPRSDTGISYEGHKNIRTEANIRSKPRIISSAKK